MIGRQRTDLPTEVYPEDPWALVEDAFSPRFLYLTETIFALSNGTLGMRGTLDEGVPAHAHGTFVNGFHETWPILHPEVAYGFAETGQSILNVPDPSVLEVTVDGATFRSGDAGVRRYRRWVDFRTGILERLVEWDSPSGVAMSMWSRRLVSLAVPELACLWLEVVADRPAHLQVASRLVNRQDRLGMPHERGSDPRRAAVFAHRAMRPEQTRVEGTRILKGWVTSNSGMGLTVGVDHRVARWDPQVAHEAHPDEMTVLFEGELEAGSPVFLTKVAAYRKSRSRPGEHEAARVSGLLDHALQLGFSGLEQLQRASLREFWDRADIEIDGPADVQRALRWTLFQLHQASATIEDGSIPAKGLTGEAYDGHYFWDTEIYVLPFLTYSNPEIAARILRFRHSMLDQARRRARDLSHRGALFPWRTINGEEASAYFLAGTAQYHINADIVYALRKYCEVTGDKDLLWEVGVEMAVETARLWEDVGFYRKGVFRIHGVTGPDEYTALVDDNAYTNLMARMNLRFAAEVTRRMAVERPEDFERLRARLGLRMNEVEAWEQAADAMYVPYDEELGITPQDDDFLSKEPWDFGSTPASKYPLLLHFHPLVIYRYQVLKQADVVLADFLLGDERDPDLKKADFDYYDPITTRDSSLSACIQAIMAAEIGYLDTAFEHFQHALFIDLADLAGNTTDGVHLASAGGVWMAAVYGFGGLRDAGGRISFDPRLPEGWRRLRFRLLVRRTRLMVEITPCSMTLETSGEPLEVTVRGERHLVSEAAAVKVELDPPQAGAREK